MFCRVEINKVKYNFLGMTREYGGQSQTISISLLKLSNHSLNNY